MQIRRIVFCNLLCQMLSIVGREAWPRPHYLAHTQCEISCVRNPELIRSFVPRRSFENVFVGGACCIMFRIVLQLKCFDSVRCGSFPSNPACQHRVAKWRQSKQFTFSKDPLARLRTDRFRFIIWQSIDSSLANRKTENRENTNANTHS